MNWDRYKILTILLFIFYTVGLIGLNTSYLKEIFLVLTPYNLLLTFVLLTITVRRLDSKYFIAFFIVFLTGYLVELAGVRTGTLFGEYTYGEPLGVKVMEVPIIIGVNWFLLAYGSAGFARNLVKNKVLRMIIAALMMVLLDVFIEPVAIHLDFWRWALEEVPFQNYGMWFATSLVIQFFLYLLKLKPDKKAGAIVFTCQFYFFFALNLILL